MLTQYQVPTLCQDTPTSSFFWSWCWISSSSRVVSCSLLRSTLEHHKWRTMTFLFSSCHRAASFHTPHSSSSKQCDQTQVFVNGAVLSIGCSWITRKRGLSWPCTWQCLFQAGNSRRPRTWISLVLCVTELPGFGHLTRLDGIWWIIGLREHAVPDLHLPFHEPVE